MLDQICPTRHHIDWFPGFMDFLDRTGQLTAGRHIFIQELRFPNTFHMPNKDTILRSTGTTAGFPPCSRLSPSAINEFCNAIAPICTKLTLAMRLSASVFVMSLTPARAQQADNRCSRSRAFVESAYKETSE